MGHLVIVVIYYAPQNPLLIKAIMLFDTKALAGVTSRRHRSQDWRQHIEPIEAAHVGVIAESSPNPTLIRAIVAALTLWLRPVERKCLRAMINCRTLGGEFGTPRKRFAGWE
jgi:hypothetical protein